MLQTYWSDVKRWAAKPYNEDGNVADWALFIGFSICMTILWTMVIRRLVD